MAENSNSRKDGLALFVAGIFVLSLVFLSYRYFNSSEDVPNVEDQTMNVITEEEGNEEVGRLERLRNILSGRTEREDEENSQDTTEQQEQQALESNGNQVFAQEKDQEQTTFGQMNLEWTANDYQEGDISGDTYTVQEGDTLWEIAEGMYGSGYNWTDILAANSGDIGHLPSGQQALIVPGQVLTMPSIG